MSFRAREVVPPTGFRSLAAPDFDKTKLSMSCQAWPTLTLGNADNTSIWHLKRQLYPYGMKQRAVWHGGAWRVAVLQTLVSSDPLDLRRVDRNDSLLLFQGSSQINEDLGEIRTVPGRIDWLFKHSSRGVDATAWITNLFFYKCCCSG